VINSVSKSHAMTGFRIGWMIGPPALIDAACVLAQSLHFGVNQFAQDAAVAALSDPSICERINAAFRERRDVLVDALAQISGLRFSPPQGGMFLLVDVAATGLNGASFADGLLDAGGVAVVPGFGFGDSLRQMVRIGFLSSPERLREAAARMDRHVRGLRGAR
jgi:arginine:pyruvate transaminase